MINFNINLNWKTAIVLIIGLITFDTLYYLWNVTFDYSKAQFLGLIHDPPSLFFIGFVLFMAWLDYQRKK